MKDHGKYHNATLDAKEALNAYDISGAKAHLSTNQELVDKLSAFATSKSFVSLIPSLSGRLSRAWQTGPEAGRVESVG